MTRVAALMPTRDRPSAARRAADSFLTALARLPQAEAVTLVVADDSTNREGADAVERMAAEVAGAHPRASIVVAPGTDRPPPTVAEPGGGPGAARNRGLGLISMMNESGVKPELECFDTGHVHSVEPLVDMGLLKTPLDFSLIMGVVGGIKATARHLAFQAENLPPGSTWKVVGISRDQWMLCAAALSLGGYVRVGLEDNFYLPNGEMARSNGDLVAKAAQMARDVGRTPATADEARAILGLARQA